MTTYAELAQALAEAGYLSDADLDAAHFAAKECARRFVVGIQHPQCVIDRFGRIVHVAVDVNDIKSGHLLGGGYIGHVAAVNEGTDAFFLKQAQRFYQVADVIVCVREHPNSHSFNCI